MVASEEVTDAGFDFETLDKREQEWFGDQVSVD
jgi:hypothetical protein